EWMLKKGISARHSFEVFDVYFEIERYIKAGLESDCSSWKVDVTQMIVCLLSPHPPAAFSQKEKGRFVRRTPSESAGSIKIPLSLGEGFRVRAHEPKRK
ncbi:MAG: hypothetical protein ABI623_12725, partial [bacterium]